MLTVMFSHYGFGHIIPGGLGVTVFFFVSGFLITTLLAVEHERAAQINVAHFYIRRFLRLGPELVAFLLLSALAGLAYFDPPNQAGSLPTYLDWSGALLYLTNYFNLFLLPANAGARWPHLWSLAVEEHYYLTFPLLFASLVVRPRILLSALGAICLGALLWRLALGHLNFPQNYAYEASDARIDSIAYGCLTALLVRYSPRAFFGRMRGGLAILSGIALLIVSVLVRDPTFREALRFSVQGVGLALVFLGLFLWSGAGPFLRAAEFAPVRWIGRLSYAAYLWHFEMVIAFGHFTGLSTSDLSLPGKVGFALSGSVVTFALAFLSYKFVYTPCAKFRVRFGSHAQNGQTATVYRDTIQAR